ncbi:hypothetical protein C8R47DRAFT_1159304 [Mycena vitilis]|nr:hypothetical protein C8R47DRAFT_1159304 [Mycena vitilis]
MSLKDELKLWQMTRNAFDVGDYVKALDLLNRMPRAAIVSTNMGLLCAAMGDHEKALRKFTDATARDPYLTIAYFQRGVSHFLLERYRPAGRDFKRAWLSLRGNEEINYEQLGLCFRLFASEVLFNLGLTRIRLGRMEKAEEYLEKAKLLTMMDDHDLIEDVIRDKGEGFTVFSLAPGVLFWPSDTKLKSIERKEFMGTATLIAATDLDDLTTGFSGLQLKANRQQKNLNRKSLAVVARRVTLVSIRECIAIRSFLVLLSAISAFPCRIVPL